MLRTQVSEAFCRSTYITKNIAENKKNEEFNNSFICLHIIMTPKMTIKCVDPKTKHENEQIFWALEKGMRA